MGKVKFGILGGGWRASFYLRIAKELPDQFEVSGVLVRDELKGYAVETEWGTKTFRTLDELLKEEMMFVVVCIPRKVSSEYIVDLAKRGIPVLAETPPAEDLESLIHLFEAVGEKAQIQVAEQYLYQPIHAARIALILSGRLGEISQVQVSAAHGYHGISLIRKMLGIGFEDAEIRGQRFTTPLIQGPNRKGPPNEEAVVKSVQEHAILNFGNRSAVYDFTYDQYFSWIRKNRVLVRGQRGEIIDAQVRYLQDYHTPMYCELNRIDTGHNGNLEGYYHQGILAGSEWAYENPFTPGRLSDDEIAIATCLRNMSSYVQGGASFYSLAEASQDQYLSLLITQALETGGVITSTSQVWAKFKS